MNDSVYTVLIAGHVPYTLFIFVSSQNDKKINSTYIFAEAF